MSIENLMAKREVQSMLIGYARVSCEDQNLALQLDALKKAGCKRVFSDKLSGTQACRPELKEALSHLREADTLAFGSWIGSVVASKDWLIWLMRYKAKAFIFEA
jgi:predicted site-specific integrase-resolvase